MTPPPMPRTADPTVSRLLAALVALLLAATLVATDSVSPSGSADAAPAPAPAPAAASGSVRSVAISMPVVNQNRTALPCEADGRTYRLRARMFIPEGRIGDTDPNRVNLMVHDFSMGRWFFAMPGRPAFDYARGLARRNEITIVIDRLGYDASPHPGGRATCLGAQADMIHQVVQRLRNGRYASDGPHPVFAYVVLHGHGLGAGIAELEAGTWGDVPGLVLMSWTDSSPSSRAVQESATQQEVCLAGGDDRVSTRHYAFYGQTRRAFDRLNFATATDGVRADAARLRNADPCGDATSVAALMATNTALTHRIGGSVLLLYGGRDARTTADGRDAQRDAYATSAAVTRRVYGNSGGALPLESSAWAMRRLVADWLCHDLSCNIG